jgi:hypothetical protein
MNCQSTPLSIDAQPLSNWRPTECAGPRASHQVSWFRDSNATTARLGEPNDPNRLSGGVRDGKRASAKSHGRDLHEGVSELRSAPASSSLNIRSDWSERKRAETNGSRDEDVPESSTRQCEDDVDPDARILRLQFGFVVLLRGRGKLWWRRSVLGCRRARLWLRMVVPLQWLVRSRSRPLVPLILHGGGAWRLRPAHLFVP